MFYEGKSSIYFKIKNKCAFVIQNEEVGDYIKILDEIVSLYHQNIEFSKKILFSGNNSGKGKYITTTISATVNYKNGNLRIGTDNFLLSSDFLALFLYDRDIHRKNLIFLFNKLVETLSIYKDNNYNIEKTIENLKTSEDYKITKNNTYFIITPKINVVMAKSARSILGQ